MSDGVMLGGNASQMVYNLSRWHYICLKMPEEHIERLRGMFEKLSAAGLRLKLSMCEFFKSRTAYLGHTVSLDGIETEKKKVTAIQEWPVPKTITEVCSFLGFTNYYHKFIPKYAQTA